MKEINAYSEKLGHQIIIVDDEDYELLSKHSWSLQKSHNTIYAKACINWKTVFMHRILMDAKSGECVDHKNFNGLDNRRCNLRKCDYSQNSANRRSKNPEGIKGVSIWSEKYPYIRAKIKVKGTTHYLGRFTTYREAAIAYNEAAIKYFGEFSYQNDLNSDHLLKLDTKLLWMHKQGITKKGKKSLKKLSTQKTHA